MGALAFVLCCSKVLGDCKKDDDCIEFCNASCVRDLLHDGTVSTRCTCERTDTPGNCAVRRDAHPVAVGNQTCSKDQDCKATCYASCQTGPNPDNYCVCVDDISPGNCGKS